ncbi:oxidoreductase [Nakamurella silvestris]|nr:oxidoreductase [Nakamurella silvestris]
MEVTDFRTVVVAEIQAEAVGVVSVRLTSTPGGRLPEWTPGAHVDLLLPDGSVRQYSLCSVPQERAHWRIAVLEEPAGRGGSTYVHRELRAGDEIRVRLARNTFPLRQGDGPVLFIAGGIGITPLLSMVRQAEQEGRDWQLMYLGSHPERMAFLTELAGYGERVRLHASSGIGRLTLGRYLREQWVGGAAAAVYACGPEPMLAELALLCGGGEFGDYHCETFVDGDAPVLDAEAEAAFVVETADGSQVTVGPGESILEALERVGVRTLSSCQQGTCGTCETPVLGGVPDHRDEILSEEERLAGETMMICVSRCRGARLVLDL